MKLHEVVAITTGKKAECDAAVTAAYHAIQKPDLFDGIRKTYQPRTEGGEKLPPENKDPHADLRAVVSDTIESWIAHIDLAATLDTGNQTARAPIIVDDIVIVDNVPVPTLLFLEKQLVNMRTFIGKLPFPDPAEKWKHDDNFGMLATEPSQTARSKKKPVVLVKAAATEQHPAQVEVRDEDVLVGDWTIIKYTNRIPSSRRVEMLAQVSKLLDAVKVARERANNIDVKRVKIGRDLLAVVFGDLMKS